MRRKTTVLLDVDGTLVDSNLLHAQAWREAFKRHGFDVPLNRILKLVGMGGDQLVPAATGLPRGSDEARTIAAARTPIFMHDYLPKVKALKGAKDLVQKLRQSGYRLVLATSAKKSELEGLLLASGLDDLTTELATTADDAAASKPAPDIVRAALAKASVEADEAVMLGDTPYDITAAKRAGVALIGLLSGGFSKEELFDADAIYDDPAALLRSFDVSLLGSQPSGRGGTQVAESSL